MTEYDDELLRFTDRQPESVAFAESLEQTWARIVSGESDAIVRRNVLAFTGRGGMGKTTLSRRLEAWALQRPESPAHWGGSPAVRVTGVARLELEGGGFSPIDAILRIRAAYGRQRQPAFDLAFAAYWNAAHPGEAIPASGGSTRAADGILESVGNLADVLGMADLFAGAGLGLISGAGRLVVKLLVEQKAFEGVPDFAARVLRIQRDATPSHPNPMLAAGLLDLLDHESRSMPPAERPLIVVAIDHFEKIQGDGRGDAEAIVSRIVHALPCVLFLITGRDTLTWYDASRSDLYKRGPRVWPGLIAGAEGNPRQHRLERLSDEDARKALEGARDRESLPLTQDLVAAIIDAANGLPLYIRLACARAEAARDNGDDELTIDDVTGSLDALVQRVLDDAPDDERDAIRAACLVPVFDTALIAAGAACSRGAAERAVRRSLIEPVDEAAGLYRVHDEIRRAIREASARVPGGWSHADWELAARRCLAHVEVVFNGSSDDLRPLQRLEDPVRYDSLVLRLNRAAVAGVHLCVDFDVANDWIVQALLRTPSLSALLPLLPRSARTRSGQALLDLVDGRVGRYPSDKRRELLREASAVPGTLGFTASRFLAYNLRSAGLFDESIAVLADLMIREPDNQTNRNQFAITNATARHFDVALDATTTLSSERRAQLLASIELNHGRPEAWLEQRPVRVSALKEEGKFREFLDAETDHRVLRTWFDDSTTPQLALALLEQCQSTGHLLGTRRMLILLATLALRDPSESERWLEVAENLRGPEETKRVPLPVAVARALSAFATNDRMAAALLRDELSDYQARGRWWIPVEVLLEQLGAPLLPMSTTWLEDEPLVRERWLRFARARLERLPLEPPRVQDLR